MGGYGTIQEAGGWCYPWTCTERLWRGVMEAVNARLGGKLRLLDGCTFSFFHVLAGAGEETSTAPLQTELLFLEQPLLLVHGDC